MKRSPLRRKTPMKKPTLEELKASGVVQSASSFLTKPRKKLKVRSPKNKGWVSVAREKWNDPQNEHLCEVCGVWLGDDFSPTFYHHLWHRGSHPSLKREPDNLAQLCLLHHDWAHKHGGPMSLEKNEMIRKEFKIKWGILANRMRALTPVNTEGKP